MSKLCKAVVFLSIFNRSTLRKQRFCIKVFFQRSWNFFTLFIARLLYVQVINVRRIILLFERLKCGEIPRKGEAVRENVSREISSSVSIVAKLEQTRTSNRRDRLNWTINRGERTGLKRLFNVIQMRSTSKMNAAPVDRPNGWVRDRSIRYALFGGTLMRLNC